LCFSLGFGNLLFRPACKLTADVFWGVCKFFQVSFSVFLQKKTLVAK
jgi:hypothetical protein